eukprot:1554111-Rhodomonas_salina.1
MSHKSIRGGARICNVVRNGVRRLRSMRFDLGQFSPARTISQPGQEREHDVSIGNVEWSELRPCPNPAPSIPLLDTVPGPDLDT